MQIKPISIFANRISYQSTCVKIRTSFGAVPVSQETTSDYYSEEFSIKRTNQEKRTSKSICEGVISSFNNLISSPTSSGTHQHRMPIVAAVVAHRRFYPAATTLASSNAGSQRSGCAVRLSARNSLVQAPKLHSSKITCGGGGGSRKENKFPLAGTSTFTASSTGGGYEPLLKGAGRPLLELKQVEALINKENANRAAILAEARRYYAKGRDKPKSKKTVVAINENEMAELIDVAKMKSQMEKIIEEMKDDYTKQLSIRGAAGALESLEVEFEGEKYPLQELAQVGRKNPQLAVLSLASLPDAIKPVLKAIEESGMNLNPQQEGTTIYVPLPKVTREHRENLAKNAKVLFTKYKGSLQLVQNKFVKQCKNQSEASTDLVFNVQQQIMKLTDTYVTEAEKLMQLKQKELLENK